MDDVSQMYKDSLAEMERLLSSRSVIGEPIRMENATIVPLLSMGFGFGAGGGTGSAPGNQGTGTGGGTGAGGGVKPVALIVSDQNGVRVERVGGPGAIESLGAAVARVMESAPPRT